MGLLKLIAYWLLGYVVYELYLGISEGSPRKAAPGGKRVRTQGQRGSAASHAVGRGVV